VAKVQISEDDDTAVQEHLSELVKESSKKKVSNKDKSGTVTHSLSTAKGNGRMYSNVKNILRD